MKRQALMKQNQTYVLIYIDNDSMEGYSKRTKSK